MALECPSVTSETFPRGYCQGASKLLAKYLVEVESIMPIEGIANGTRYLPSDGDSEWPIEQSHFWLEHAGYIIDITADQFEDGPEPVVVTTDRSWYDRFQGQTRLSQDVVLQLNDYLLERYSRMQRFFSDRGRA
jgi:hypothetical protein